MEVYLYYIQNYMEQCIIEKYKQMASSLQLSITQTLEDYKDLFLYAKPRDTEVETFAKFATKSVGYLQH